MRGHNFTHCATCGKEYVCGDCVTTGCEMGRNKLKCEHYQAHIRQNRAAASTMSKIAADSAKPSQTRAAARLLGGLAWDEVCKSLSNSELANALKEKVWSEMELGTEEIALMEQAIDRLEAKGEK